MLMAQIRKRLDSLSCRPAAVLHGPISIPLDLLMHLCLLQSRGLSFQSFDPLKSGSGNIRQGKF